MIRIGDTEPASIFAFKGRALDKEPQSSQLRHFDPAVGRWLDEEPVGYQGDANLHRYPGNRTNPGYVIGDGNRLLSDGTYTYAYDEDGNRTARYIDVDEDGVLDAGDTDITQYTWDSRHRLAKVTDYEAFADIAAESPEQVVTYLYDVENRWIGETIDSNGDGTVDHQTRFVYDGNQIVLQFDKDASGDVTPADLTHRYLWGPAVDQVLADEQVTNPQTAGNVVWPLTDHLGTVRDLALYDAQTGDTTVANHRVYDSFGNLKSETNAATDCLFGFTGRPEDTSTGLRNHGNRWTDPRTGDWMSEDPIGLIGRDANTHRYCGNNPMNATDPSGLFLGLPRWSDYKFYLFNPSREDAWCRYGQIGALAVSAVAGAAAGGLAIAGAGGAAAGGGAAAAGGGAAAASLGVGSQAVVAPGLAAQAGVWYPALLVNGTVFVARFHAVAWEMASNGQVQKYGMVMLDAAGKVIGWK